MKLSRFLFRLLFGKRLPIHHGTLVVDGPRSDVLIRRDRWGIPHIEASEDHDAWFGLGFCHGQDRAFQIEALARVVRGTFSQMVGRDGLPVDRLSRRIGFRRAARQRLSVQEPELQDLVRSYAQGVRAGTRQGQRRRPHEFVLLRCAPTSYTEEDVAGLVSLLSFLLASNWDIELARLRILRDHGPEALAILDPSSPAWLPATFPPGALAGRAVERLAEDLAIFQAHAGRGGGGSNNWALAGSRTASGRPLLANDPHLAPVLPCSWYLAHVKTPRWGLAGATMVGTPSFSAGHNDWAAWGITAGLVDNTDLFLEEVGPDGSSVRCGDRFEPCELVEERIDVRGDEAVVEKVLVTPRGPIISPALDGENAAVSLRATWLEPRPVRGTLCLAEVREFEDFCRTFRSWPAVPLNMMYADCSGTVGWQLVGDAPRRRKGWGTLPLPGADPEAGWYPEPVPFDEMPRGRDPSCGFLATANNQPLPQGTGPFLGVDFLDGFRQARILEMLESRHDWDVERCLALQLDQYSIPWREMRDAVLQVPRDDPGTAVALDLLEDWDGTVSADSPAAAVFELLVSELAKRLARLHAPRSEPWVLGMGYPPLLPYTMMAVRRVGHLVQLLREQRQGALARSWPEELTDALSHVVGWLKKRHGADPAAWAWGRLRGVRFQHAFGTKKILRPIFDRGPFPCGGDANTVAQAAVDLLEPTSEALFTVSLRMVADVGNWDACRFVLAGGQSGNPLSHNYDDQIDLWRRGMAIPMPYSTEAVKKASKKMLRLSPNATLRKSGETLS